MGKKCTITVKDEVWCYIAGLLPSENEVLWNAFAPHVDGYFFQPKFKLGTWDGRIRFYQRTGKTYIRLLDKILPYLDSWGYEVVLIDNRKSVTNPTAPGKITKCDSLGIATAADGLNVLGDDVEVGGKTFYLRPYQLQCVHDCIDAGSGFIVAGTGAGKCLSGCTSLNVKVPQQLKKAIQHVKAKNLSHISEQITVTFYELFEAITLLENHEFQNNEEYIQSTAFQVETVDGYVNVEGLIKKVAPLFQIILDDGSIIKCADRHILFDNNGEKFAENFKIGDLVKTVSGYSTIVSIKKISDGENVYDIEVKNNNHQYITTNGVIHHNTSITGVLSHVYSSAGYKTITIVPSSDLVDQTYDWYELLGLDVGRYSGDNKDVDHLNVVATWQALQYNPSVLLDFQCLIWDESHCIRAAVAQKLINEYGKHIPFRFGVTGTFPKSESDQLSLFSSMGPILREIPAAWLIEHNYLAKVEIQPVELNETFVDEEFPDYSAERAFLSKSSHRMEMIANIIISQCANHGNTLVLVNSIPFGEKLSCLIKNSVFLYGNSPKDLRKEHYEMFDKSDDLIVIASSGIASTGISIDRIFCLILVDAGKSFIKAIQSIGRGLRKGHDKEAVVVIDVHSKLKWARKHYKDRAKHYKEANYPILKKQTLKVKD